MRTLLTRLKTALIRKPRNEWRRYRDWGLRAYLLIDQWKEQMEEAARHLVVTNNDMTGPPIDVWFLTGRNFWYQTAFCGWTLAQHSSRPLIVNIVDDGSLTSELEQRLRRLFPLGVTKWRQESFETFSDCLPQSRYPTLHKRWHDYINIHKLTAPHVGSTGWQLVLDSDMLFFSRPDELIKWSDRRQEPCLMVDCIESYGYSRKLLQKLSGSSPVPCMNVGVCGMQSEQIDWDEMEYWCRTLEAEEGTSYFLEQAVVAMNVSRLGVELLPMNRYVTSSSFCDATHSGVVMAHYVSNSKPFYFQRAWRLASSLQLHPGL